MANAFKSERLVYSAVESSEHESFLHSLNCDADIQAVLSSSLHKPMALSDTKKFIEYLSGTVLMGVVICLPPPSPDAKPVPIGMIHLTPQDAHHRHSMIGIAISKVHQGKGYGSEAINWILEWGFKRAGLHSIEIACFSYNEGAKRLYERLGFVLEGRKRERYWYNGGWWDEVQLGMLEQEWREREAKKTGLIAAQ